MTNEEENNNEQDIVIDENDNFEIDFQYDGIPEIFFDTETTGKLAKYCGIVELGMVKRIGGPDGQIVGKLHLYFKHNPSDRWEDKAQEVHKLSREFLADKPSFDEEAEKIINFVKGCDIIAHNANFDIKFINKELERAKFDNIYSYINKVYDTEKMSKAARSGAGKRHSLDALNKEFEFDDSIREKRHGALIDAELLVPVFDKLKSMTDGKISNYEEDIPRKPIEYITNLGGFQIPMITISESDRLANESILNDIEKEEKIVPIARKKDEPQQEKPAENKNESAGKFSLKNMI